MAEILTQSEIDQLLEQFHEGKLDTGLEVAERETTEKSTAVVYDFRHPNRVARDQLRTLRIVHESFAKQIESYLSTRLRTPFAAKIDAIDQVTYVEFQLSLSDPSCVCVVGVEGFKADLVVELGPALTFLAIDRLFGGSGQPVGEFREMSRLELKVIQRLLESLLRYYDQAWKPIYEIHTQLKAIHSRPSFAQVVAPGEMVVAISIGLSAEGFSGAVNVCLPYLLLQDIMPRIGSSQLGSATAAEKSPEDRQLLERKLKGVKVQVGALLGKASISLKELLELQVGDVLLLDSHTDDVLPVIIAGEERAKARIGLHRKKLALKVETVRHPEE